MPLSTVTPPSITAHVRQLCDRINPNVGPVYVRVVTDANATVNNCFINVRAKVEAEGGRIQYGWSISQCLPLLIEAEHHAVYEAPSGPPWIDVTPPSINSSTTLFLPDDAAEYDFSTNARRDNVRMPLTDDPRVHEFCALFEEQTRILNSVPGFGVVSIKGPNAGRMVAIERRKMFLWAQFNQEFGGPQRVGRNDPCPCESGRKYKKCCGR